MSRLIVSRSSKPCCYMSIPADPNRDADLIVSGAIDELESRRKEVAHVIARLRDAALEKHNACDAMKPPQFTAEARMYVRGAADALGSFADELVREQREGSR